MKKILIVLSLIGLVACKSRQHADPKSADSKPATPQSAPANNNAMTTKTAPSSTQPDSFRVVVSFISIGAGTDPDATSLLDQYLTKFAGSSGTKPEFQRIAWGREGEVDNCFELKGMTPARQTEFIDGLNKAMYGHNLIQIVENMKNRFKK